MPTSLSRLKAGLSGVVIAVASEVARRWPGWGALIVSLPLVSVLAMIWLWRDTHDPVRLDRRFTRFASEFEWYAGALAEARKKGVPY